MLFWALVLQAFPWLGICCSTVPRHHQHALKYMMRLELVEELQVFQEDFCIRILLKVATTHSCFWYVRVRPRPFLYSTAIIPYHMFYCMGNPMCMCIVFFRGSYVYKWTSGSYPFPVGLLLFRLTFAGKLLWNGAECWEEALKLITVAEASVISELPSGEIDNENKQHTVAEPFVWRRGILRIAATAKNVYDLKKSAQDSLSDCKISFINSFAAKELLPELVLHSDFALYMPQAINIHPERYLKALFMACQRKARDLSAAQSSGIQVSLHKRNVGSLLEFSGGYDAVIICLGAKVGLLPELVGKLPLSTCKGIVAHLELPTAIREIYNNESPSILSSAWLAAQGPRKILIGATKEWGSFNTSCDVSIEEASLALKELLPKISTVYPAVKNWMVLGTRAGLRAMPPRTSLGALPLIGCIDNLVLESMQKDNLFGRRNTYSSQKVIPRYWFVGGLGSRGLIYHGLLGKLIAKAVASGNQDVLPSELTSWMLSC